MGVSLRRKMKLFLTLIFVIAALSAGLTAYLSHQRYARNLERYATVVKSQALMVKDRGEQLRRIASSMADADASGQSPGDQRQFVARIRQQAADLEGYATDVIEKMDSEIPGDALTNMAEIQLMVPENLETIKANREEIEKLRKRISRLTSRSHDLLISLNHCRSRKSQDELYYSPYPTSPP